MLFKNEIEDNLEFKKPMRLEPNYKIESIQYEGGGKDSFNI
jgi:hypothetical protein